MVTNIADSNTVLFGNFVNLFGKLLASFFCKSRYRQSNDLAVV